MTTTKDDVKDSDSLAMPTSWQAGLYTWFGTYITAKRFLLPTTNGDDESDAIVLSKVAKTGLDVYRDYEQRQKFIYPMYNRLLAILSLLIQNGQNTCPLRPSSQRHASGQRNRQQQTASFSFLPIKEFLQCLCNVRHHLMLAIAENQTSKDATVSSNDSRHQSFLNTYLNRKHCGEDKSSHDDSSDKNGGSSNDSVLVGKLKQITNSVNELIVLVAETQKQLEGGGITAKAAVETNRKYLLMQWDEVVSQIQRIVDTLGLFMRERPTSNPRVADIKDFDQTSNMEEDDLWSAGFESLVAHLRQETVEAALSKVVDNADDVTTVASSSGGGKIHTIPTSQVPGILLEALFVKDRITITRKEWFELFCSSLLEMLPGLEGSRAATKAQRQHFADLFVLGIWFLIHCGFIQEKVQRATASELGSARGGTIIVYEKISLVWCSGEG